MRLSVPQLIRALLIGFVVFTALTVSFAQPHPARSQDGTTPVPAAFVEAIQEANVRSGPALTYAQVGKIVAGTTYPMVGRSSHFPWYLIALPDTQGWVYADLVKVTGNLSAVPYTEVILDVPPSAPSASTVPPTTAVTQALTTPATAAPQMTTTEVQATLTPVPVTPTPVPGVYAEAKDSANVRYGPGTDFPRIGTIHKGQSYQVLRRHTMFEKWIEIAYPEVASGRGWVYLDTMNITGNIYSVPATSMRDFGYPTLTPTPPMVVTGVPPWTVTPSGSVDLALAKLSNDIYDYLLKQNFVPGTDRQGSIFLMDLKTGQSFSLNPNVEYSAMSLIKIPILVSFFRKLDFLPNEKEAEYLVEMMDCSENTASNAVLRFLGDGDAYRGAAYVTETMQKLGLKDTFLLTPIDDGTNKKNVTPTDIPSQPLVTPITGADQTSTDPDPFSQSTPADLGWLLSGVYQCAIDGTGPLISTFPNSYTMNECRQMVRTMRANKIGALVEAGVPLDIPVAHKHGWIPDTHGDAALVTTPGGDYVLTAMLYNKTWLNYSDSFPAVAEISRMTYNAYNPNRLVAETHTKSVPECTLASVDPQLLKDLQAPDLPPIR